MAVDPSIPFNTGKEHVGFTPTRQALLDPSAKRNVGCSTSRMKGELHPLLRLDCEADILAMWMLASSCLICFLVRPLPETALQKLYYVTTSSVPPHIYLAPGTHNVIRPFPLVRNSRFFTPHK